MLITLLGCATIDIDGGNFFPALSAFSYPAWDVEIVGLSSPGDGATSASADHTVALSDVTLGCMRAQAYQVAWNAASAQILSASDDGHDEEAWCAAAPSFLYAMEEAEANYPPELQRLSFAFCVEGVDTYCGGDVPAREIALGDEEVGARGRYRLDRQPERLALGDYWDPAQCALDLEAIDADTEVDDDRIYDVAGTVTITGDGQVLAGEWEGTLEGDGDLGGAETSGTFSSSLCEVETSDTLVVTWW